MHAFFFLTSLPLWCIFLSIVCGQDALEAEDPVEIETSVVAPSQHAVHGHHEHRRLHQKQWIRSDEADLKKPEKRGSSTFVFFHYMIGTVTDPHAQQDIQSAVAVGADAFALNIADVTSSWSLNTCSYLFKYAQANNFKLFFSFDMTSFSNPNQFTSFLAGYVNNSAYFRYGGYPLVSSFNGGAGNPSTVNSLWQTNLKNAMSAKGSPVAFMPAWSDVTASSSFFSNFPVCDGAMNWDSWPFQSQGNVNVSTSVDLTYQNAAKSAGKRFIMGASPLQFKHLDSNNNFYRRGRGNFDNRVGQLLQLQPDMVEFQTWNDVGESHNMGKAWPEGISCCPNIQAYSVDHSAFLEIMPTLIKAIKTNGATLSTMYPANGKTVQGIFYYHKLLANGNCGSDSLGKPSGSNLIEDVVTCIIYLNVAARGWRVQVISNGQTIANVALTTGYNNIEATGVQAGTVQVNVVDGTNTVKFTATGPNPVMASSSLCNYNFEVAALASTS